MAEEKEIQTEKKEAPKGIKRTIGAILGIIILGGIGYFIHDALMFQSTDDAYVETTTVQVSPKIAGHITKVYVKDNQAIKAGMVVAEIDDTDYRVKLEKAEANYQKVLLNQKNAQANFKAMQTNISVAKKDLDRYTALYESGAVSKQTLDAAQAKYDSAQANLTQAEEALLSPNDNKVADADLRAVKAELDQAKLNMQYTKVIAPQDGTVSSRRVETGMYVQPGSPLFVIVPNNVWVVANFKENQLRHMRAGQPVDIKIDTYPDHVFKGEVESIQRSSGARIPVKIIFTEKYDTNEYNVVPGMSVIPKVRVK